MRTALLSLFLMVAACNDDNNRLASLESTTSDLTAIRAELAALRAQVGAMPAMPDVKPLADRLAAVEASVAKLSEARKVPHLVAFAGSDREVDLGLGSPGSRCAWNAVAGGEVCFDRAATVRFDGENCDGNAYVDPIPPSDRSAVFLRASDGRVFHVDEKLSSVSIRSALIAAGGDCMKGVDPQPRELQSLGLVAKLPTMAPVDLSVALR